MLEDWKVLSVFRHVCGVKLIAPDPSGARVVFVDDKGDTLLFNPVNDAVLEVPDAPLSATGVLWDQQAPGEGCFIVYDETTINTYVYRADHYTSPKVEKIGSMARAHGIVPITLINGVIVCITPSGRTSDETLDTHTDVVRSGAHETHPKSCALQNTVIGRFHEALVAAYTAGDDEVWEQLYKASLRALDLPTARKCAQARGDPAASAALGSIEHIEDSNLLSGHVALMLGETQLAEKMFLASSEPLQALQMHRDLLNWEVAMQLAEKDSPSQIPYISREYAQQLEFQSAFGQALSLYEQGVTSKPGDERHDNMCRAGMARMMIRNGDVAAGKRLAEELNVRQLWRDCAQILSHLGQFAEAAHMYKQGEQPDKAGGMYIRLKNWAKVEELLPQMQSSKLVVKYARAREHDGAFGEAAKAYEQAGEFDAVIRISLDHLSNPDEAVRIVKKTGSVEGAKLVAKFFMNLPGGGDPGSAIQFLVMSGAAADAFQLAHKHDKMGVYANQLGDAGSPGDYKSIAVYYEKQDNFVESGHFYTKAGEHDKALALLLKANDPDNRHIDLAIEVVGKAQSEQLMDKLIDYVMGEVDGSPKDAKYLFKAYIAMKQYTEAARTAVIIAREDQMSGEYRKAHGVLFEMYRTLETQGVRIPMEMQKNLMILHSYLMVKVHIKRQDHLTATRLLLRVAENISLFPSHVVNILTTTVIECWKTGLKSSGFGYAAMLTRPEYRPKLDPKYKPKIEKIARSFRKEKDDVDEEMVPSPFDPDAKVPAFVLMCPSTSNVIPYCIVTGRVMQIDDWTKMPCCGFPALHSAIIGMADGDGSDEVAAAVTCPMCSEEVTLSTIKQESEPSAKALLRKFNQAASSLSEGSAND
jgi:WD repeat-containing protein 19